MRYTSVLRLQQQRGKGEPAWEPIRTRAAGLPSRKPCSSQHGYTTSASETRFDKGLHATATSPILQRPQGSCRNSAEGHPAMAARVSLQLRKGPPRGCHNGLLVTAAKASLRLRQGSSSIDAHLARVERGPTGEAASS